MADESTASLLSGGENIQTGVAAHIVALTQSLHATLDTLGHVIAFATGLNITKIIQEDKISLRNVIRTLESIADTNKLSDLCKDFYNSDERKYLSHLVNYSKHRSIVRPDIHVDATGIELRTFKLVFDGFNYSGRKYQPKDVDLVLEPTYSLISNAIVKIGCELNFVLSNRVNKHSS